MINKRNVLLLFAFFTLFSLLSPRIDAIGVSPGRTSVDYAPRLEKTISFSLVNTEGKDVDIVLAAQGELAEYIEFDNRQVHITSKETSKDLIYTIILPEGMEPGLHTAEIVILQLPEQGVVSEAYVGTAVAVVTQLHVSVPYPGKYAEAEVYILAPNEEGKMEFVIPVHSKGDFDLVKVEATIDIFTSLNEKVASLKTNTEKIPSGTRKELRTFWDARAASGPYRAVVTVTYDEETLTIEKEFNVGLKKLRLENIEVNDFKLGDIAKFEMLVKNDWSEDVKGVYAQIEIYNENGQLLADFKSPTYDISALEKTLMISFWDTKGVRKGLYDAVLLLKYGESIEQQDLKLEVKDYEINIVGFGYDFNVKDTSNRTLVIILISVIIILVIANLSWFLYFRKRFSENYKTKEKTTRKVAKL